MGCRLPWVHPLDAPMIAQGPYMTTLKKIVFVALLGFAMLGITGCFYESSSSNQPGSNQTACDANNKNCQSTTKSYWGFVF